jgi:hypothetical protein
MFGQNIARYCARPDLVSEMARDSLAIGPLDVLSIIERVSLFQVFSIDGGHTPEHVINDYGIAAQVTRPRGFIIVDDILNAAWPGVIEGVARLFLFGRPKFVPLCIGLNKLLLNRACLSPGIFAVCQASLPRMLPLAQYFSPSRQAVWP